MYPSGRVDTRSWSDLYIGVSAAAEAEVLDYLLTVNSTVTRVRLYETFDFAKKSYLTNSITACIFGRHMYTAPGTSISILYTSRPRFSFVTSE